MDWLTQPVMWVMTITASTLWVLSRFLTLDKLDDRRMAKIMAKTEGVIAAAEKDADRRAKAMAHTLPDTWYMVADPAVVVWRTCFPRLSEAEATLREHQQNGLDWAIFKMKLIKPLVTEPQPEADDAPSATLETQ